MLAAGGGRYHHNHKAAYLASIGNGSWLFLSPYISWILILWSFLRFSRISSDLQSVQRKAESEFQDLQEKIAAAPLGLRGPLAEAFLLPYDASPVEIARAVPRLPKRAKEIADHHMARGRQVGPLGSLWVLMVLRGSRRWSEDVSFGCMKMYNA